jgi:hypothetical protein
VLRRVQGKKLLLQIQEKLSDIKDIDMATLEDSNTGQTLKKAVKFSQIVLVMRKG